MYTEVLFYPERGTETVFIKIRGQRFWDILTTIKENAQQYGLKYDPQLKMWYGHLRSLYRLTIDFLHDAYTVDPDMWGYLVRRVAEIDSRTEITYSDLEIDPECILAPPMVGIGENVNFQLDCVKRGIKQNRLALYLDMGLGKTMIQISILNHLIKHQDLQKVLIITPTETVYNWIHELKRFSVWKDQIEDITYVADRFHRDPFDPNYKIVICSYRTFLMLCDDVKRKSKNKLSDRYAFLANKIQAWCPDVLQAALVLDESHALKNPDARQTRVIVNHREFFHYRFCMSGTPAPNGAHEFYSQMKLLDEYLVPKTYSAYKGLITAKGSPEEKRAVVGRNQSAVQEFDRRFKRVAIRLKTTEAIRLPDLVIENVYVKMPAAQDSIYKGVINSLLLKLKDETGKINPREVQMRFPFMSLALDNPEMLKGRVLLAGYDERARKYLDQWQFEDHGKLPVLKDLLDTYVKEENRKVIVFDYHPDTIDRLGEMFKEYGALTLHGQMCMKDKTKERDAIIQKFRTDPNCHVLFASFLILNTGVNLQEATRVVYFSRNYSLVNYLQSMKRAHRIGSQEKVVVHPLIFEDSLNVYQDAILRRKKAFDDNVFKLDAIDDATLFSIFSGAGISISSASSDELGIEEKEEEEVIEYSDADYNVAQQSVCIWN